MFPKSATLNSKSSVLEGNFYANLLSAPAVTEIPAEISHSFVPDRRWPSVAASRSERLAW
jgi:hypothetical protein